MCFTVLTVDWTQQTLKKMTGLTFYLMKHHLGLVSVGTRPDAYLSCQNMTVKQGQCWRRNTARSAGVFNQESAVNLIMGLSI